MLCDSCLIVLKLVLARVYSRCNVNEHNWLFFLLRGEQYTVRLFLDSLVLVRYSNKIRPLIIENDTIYPRLYIDIAINKYIPPQQKNPST